jgi:hypothetical protein
METATQNKKTPKPIAGLPLTDVTTAPVSGLEPFVDAQVVSEFLAVTRADVLKLTREGKIRGYAYKGQQRHVYRYRLSEVSSDFVALLTPVRSTISAAAPVSQRRKLSNG